MTIRFKILALAFAILVVFGMVVGISTWLQHQFMNQIVAITRYHIPLRTIIADFDVRTDRYEMIILRLLRQPTVIQNELEATRSQAQQEAKRIADDLVQFDALVDKALADPTVARQSASIFSELKGATPFIERQLDPFFKIGEQVLQAAADGRLDEARNLSLEFRKTEAAFGPDTAALREKLAMLTSAVGSAALSSQSIIQDLDLILFALAGCLGWATVSWPFGRRHFRRVTLTQLAPASQRSSSRQRLKASIMNCQTLSVFGAARLLFACTWELRAEKSSWARSGLRSPRASR